MIESRQLNSEQQEKACAIPAVVVLVQHTELAHIKTEAGSIHNSKARRHSASLYCHSRYHPIVVSFQIHEADGLEQQGTRHMDMAIQCLSALPTQFRQSIRRPRVCVAVAPLVNESYRAKHLQSFHHLVVHKICCHLEHRVLQRQARDVCQQLGPVADHDAAPASASVHVSGVTQREIHSESLTNMGVTKCLTLVHCAQGAEKDAEAAKVPLKARQLVQESNAPTYLSAAPVHSHVEGYKVDRIRFTSVLRLRLIVWRVVHPRWFIRDCRAYAHCAPTHSQAEWTVQVRPAWAQPQGTAPSIGRAAPSWQRHEHAPGVSERLAGAEKKMCHTEDGRQFKDFCSRKWKNNSGLLF